METKTEEVTEQRVEKALSEFKPNPAFMVASAMLPKSYKEVMELSSIMAKSGIVPKDMVSRPEACAVAIMLGLELGVSPQAAIQNIMVVNGRPSVWGDLFKALIVNSGKCELFDEDPAHVALKQGFGRCHLIRKKEFGGGEIEHVFSIEDAKKAKLWTKTGPWQDYPGRMLQMRPRSWAGRDLFADVLKGMQMREEVDDFEILEPSHVRMPERTAVKRTETAQSGAIMDAEVVSDSKPENAQPAKPQKAEQGSQKSEPTEKINQDQRKVLFEDLAKAKISLPEFKDYLHTLGIQSTSEILVSQIETIMTWMVKSAKA